MHPGGHAGLVGWQIPTTSTLICGLRGDLGVPEGHAGVGDLGGRRLELPVLLLQQLLLCRLVPPADLPV